MPTVTQQQQLFNQANAASSVQQFLTLGIVVDTNDPREDGRIRVVCAQWGDSMDQPIDELPWAMYMTPFGGQTQVTARGPGIQQSTGGIAYGMWSIPKVGATVAVMCVDGDPMHRIYIGCVFDQAVAHTMPHGRYMYDDHPQLEKEGSDAAPYGPYTSMEKFIQPLASNQKQAFSHKAEPNFEYRTRGADYSAAGISVETLNRTYSSVQDDNKATHDGWTSTQGYQVSRSDPNAASANERNYDSQTYSIVSPGFHAFSMDDRQENCRVRIRTTSGHQILLDDTNERIYVSTARGNNWVEMDQNGTIDVFATNKINIHSAKDINLTSDESIRMLAGTGIHMHSNAGVHITSVGNLNLSGANASITAVGAVNIKSGTTLNLQSGTVNVLAPAMIRMTGGQIHMNSASAPAAAATSAESAEFTTRVPQHEPWPRTSTASGTSQAPEFAYDDPRVNRQEGGTLYDRGMFWRR